MLWKMQSYSDDSFRDFPRGRRKGGEVFGLPRRNVQSSQHFVGGKPLRLDRHTYTLRHFAKYNCLPQIPNLPF